MKKRKFSFQPYPFIMLLAALITGILLQDNLQSISLSTWLAGLITSAVISILLHLLSSKYAIQSFFGNALLILSFVFLGGIICYLQNDSNITSWYGKYLNRRQALKIQLDETPIEKPKTLLLKTSVKAISINNKWIAAEGKLWVYVYKKNNNKQFNNGQTFIIPNELVEIKSSGNPFAFDQSKYANRNGLYHQCFLSNEKILLLDSNNSKSSLISNLRTSLKNVISKNIEDTTTKALILAMVVNDRTQLEPELVNAYSLTGTTHIIAISGMHVILLASIILFIIGKIPLRHVKNSRYLWAMVLVWIYIAITGFPPSAVRAAVMFSLYAIGNSLKRDSQQVNTWAASGFILLCYNPYWIYDVGFQLSFLAVLSILLFTKSIVEWWQPKNHILDVLWKTIAIGISVQILVFPLVIYYFNQFPLMGFIANIPAGLFSTILMIGTIILITINSLGLSAIWIGKLLTYLTKAFHSFLFILSELSPESFRMLYIDAVDYWITMAIIICFCTFLYFRKSMQLFAGLAFSILLVINFIRKDWIAFHQEKIIVYNTTNESNVSIIKGHDIFHIYPYNEKTYKYAIKPAILGFRVKETKPENDSGNIFYINNKKILLLGSGDIQQQQTFPVDVLVVSNNCTFEPETWFETFHPKLIIIDGSLPRWKAMKWKETLTHAGAKTRWVQDSGACVYPGL
ncbi:ComEC family competence protein [Taibaiella lutea]|uniref:ComEC family competence protein n=1 Tax=Taibaiella lutea TaxID=2608001 RepID=A0A5M6CIC7_9BACT|nr:ComEC/Rec2 family competence protein [Taibaiella lutea]KAA5533135.1 ComEC family competence protein [Taibaiella lutea]